MFALLPALALLAVSASAQNTSSTVTERDIEGLEANFKQAQLVPQLISDFEPEALLSVSFGGQAISIGDKLDKDAVASSPELTVSPAPDHDLDAGALYTVLMADANAVGTDQNVTEQTRHWLVNGVSLSGDTAPYTVNYTGATTITDYAGPGPFEGTGSHRYVIAVYEQGSDFAAPANLSTSGVALGTWFLSGYVSESKLGDLLTANYFQVENGQATSTAEATTSVDSATLAAAASTTGASGSAASGASATSGSASGASGAGTSATSAAASASGSSGAGAASGAGKTGVAAGMIMGAVGVVGAVVGAAL
ncbi:uncharacterized protein I303_100455 [Kwoniella dejecticola CBS 10117]|uniref:Nuclear protein n=1 Tax=Kwoniella dejecticola CBS 10117 TaxID=1296121 RepID=A0A1A6AF34_9TREE|nr:uncharacterized protein I303_00455 [Kwoniella dejecticola CBS 10117]OBR88638.1 hypothetical protein I303_00455 [Kwoniella dejecticola CBS 10117]